MKTHLMQSTALTVPIDGDMRSRRSWAPLQIGAAAMLALTLVATPLTFDASVSGVALSLAAADGNLDEDWQRHKKNEGGQHSNNGRWGPNGWGQDGDWRPNASNNNNGRWGPNGWSNDGGAGEWQNGESGWNNEWENGKNDEGGDDNEWGNGKNDEGGDDNEWENGKNDEGGDDNEWENGKNDEGGDDNEWENGKNDEGGE